MRESLRCITALLPRFLLKDEAEQSEIKNIEYIELQYAQKVLKDKTCEGWGGGILVLSTLQCYLYM